MGENHALYYQYNPWWEAGYQARPFIARPHIEARLIDNFSNNSVILLTGLRRVGKTSLMKNFIYTLLNLGYEPRHIFYVSLDDYQLKDLSIIDVLDEYRKIHRLSYDTAITVFLDEISYKEDFRLQLKNLYDKQKVKVYASSSSASSLRDQKGFLTGRERLIDVSPLDFEEFLTFRQITVKAKDSGLLKSYFEEYMQIGGMPEFVLNNDRGYLTELVNDIIYKDIVAYHGLRHPNLIKDFFVLLMERAGKQCSINKLANILGISPDTSKRYLQMFEETFLIDRVQRYGKTNEVLLSPPKIYAADLGIRNLFTGFRDKGAIFENYVYTKIKKFEPRYLYKDKIEIDFITNQDVLIEVKYGREIENKQKAMFESYDAKKKLLIKSMNDLKLLDEL